MYSWRSGRLRYSDPLIGVYEMYLGRREVLKECKRFGGKQNGIENGIFCIAGR